MNVRRSKIILDPDTLPSEGRPWTLAILGLLAVMIALMPAAFGAVEAWSELVVVICAAALSFCLVIRFATDRTYRPTRTWLYLPLAIFIALVAFQILPLPTQFIGGLSPAAVSTRQDLLSDAGGLGQLSTFSMYPLATSHQLRLILVGTTIFVVVANALRKTADIKLLLAIILAIGSGEALLALAQIATGTGSIYWSVPVRGAGVTSGSFINYSHFCQFMNLSLGAGIALLLVRVEEDRRSGFRGPSSLRTAALLTLEKHGWVICCLAICALSVLTSMSRNGAISLTVAAAAMAAALFRRGTLSWRGWLIGITPLIVIILLLMFGFDELYDRLATLQHSDAIGGRWEMTQSTLRAWSAFPIWGAGLGTHEFVFPMFDTSKIVAVAAHADNDYAQLLEETGLLGAVLVIAFVAGIAILAWKLMFQGRKSVSNAAFGIAFGLLAVAIHSATDFGQRVPANFGLSAIFCGLLVAIDRMEGRSRRKGSKPASSRSMTPSVRWATAASCLVALSGIWTWAIANGYWAYQGENWWAAVTGFENELNRVEESQTDQVYMDLIAAADAAVRNQPGNVKYGYGLNLYRWNSLSRVVDPETGNIVLREDVVPFVERIADELTNVRRICPTYGPTHALEGELRLFVLKDPRGQELIRHAVELAPNDAPTCLIAGELAARSGELEEAVQLLTRAVELNPSLYRNAVEIYLAELRRPDLAKALAGDNYRRLSELATLSGEYPEYSELSAEFSADAENSLRRHANTDGAQAYEVATLAQIEIRRGDIESAIDLYRRALNLDYKQVGWRLALAQALIDTGHRDEALREVRICLRLRPQHATAVRLLDQLSGDADGP